VWPGHVTNDGLTGGARQTVPVGERFDRRVTPVTRRGVGVAGTRVVRVLVRDETGAEFPALVAPTGPPLFTTEPGRWYQFDGLLGSAPPAPPVGEAPCPGCGGPTRRGCAADTVDPAVAGAAIRVGVDEPFAVVDGQTAVTRADGAPDDRDGGPPDDPPAAVCDACVDIVA